MTSIALNVYVWMFIAAILIILLALEYIKNKNNAQNNLKLTNDLQTLQANISLKEEEIARARSEIQRLNDENKIILSQKENIAIACAKYENQNINLQDQKKALENKVQELEALIDSLTKTNQENYAKLQTYIATSENKDKLLAQQQQHFTEAQHDLERRFNATQEAIVDKVSKITEELLQKRGNEFNQKSNESLTNIINPLKENLTKFQTLIQETRTQATEQHGSLKNELERLNKAQVTLSEQANNLTNALKNNSKNQGMWGEHILELALEDSGLREGTDYKREQSFSAKDDNSRLRPDVVIYLPHKKHLIVDAKCSLTDYCDFVNTTQKADKESYLQKHIKSLKRHVDELYNKKYENLEELSSPSFVLMFVPNDGALAEAISYDKSLYTYAKSKNVFLVSPVSLIPTLRLISDLWVTATQNDKLQVLWTIAKNIAAKTDKLQNNIEKLKKQNELMGKEINDFESAFSSGRGNVIGQLKKFDKQASLTLIEDNIDADIYDFNEKSSFKIIKEDNKLEIKP